MPDVSLFLSVLQQALELSVNLLEKVSVLLSTALVLVLLRPAEVWLSETGRMASRRRRLFILAIFTPIAIWGIFLGFEIDGLGFNTRSVGIIVAGLLGGRRVGCAVGAIAGAAYALVVPDDLAWFVFAASIIDGGVAGLVARYFGVSVKSVALGAIAAQLAHHISLGAVLFMMDVEAALSIAGNVPLHTAKITANTIGVVLFMSLLTLARDLQLARTDAQTSREVARSARLEALQYQLQPHFLFNILNTLAYLIRVEPLKARQLTLDLADFLRYTLSREDDDTTLREELKQIARYVELERARFGDGLRFELPELDEHLAARVTLPPLILQPLVENSIRHGAQEGKVCVTIEVESSDSDHVWIRVLDDGPGPRLGEEGDSEERDEEGDSALPSGGRAHHRSVGLHNVRERLARYYDEEVVLVLRPRDSGQGACAEFLVPLDGGPA